MQGVMKYADLEKWAFSLEYIKHFYKVFHGHDQLYIKNAGSLVHMQFELHCIHILLLDVDITKQT